MMNPNLSALFLGGKELVPFLKKDFRRIYGVESPRGLVRGLMERSVDLVVIENDQMTYQQQKKIFQTYSCPFFVLHDKKITEEDEYGIYHVTAETILERFEALSVEIRNIKFRRQNTELLELLESVKEFEDAVKNVGKDLLIREVDQYFERKLSVEKSFWVKIQEPNLNLPPILRCKQELLKQEVNFSGLIQDIDACVSEVISEDQFQVWKTRNGRYMAYFWLESPGEDGQCIVMNDLRFLNILELKNLLTYLVPILSRRWALSLTVEQAQVEVFKDSLTDLYNQRYLTQILAQKIEEEKRYKTPFTILFLDVDHFKKVNDSKGHIVGSSVLVALGQLLAECIRTTDFAFRYGGDEFIVLLGHTDDDEAEVVAERIRHTVEAEEFAVLDQIVKITVSIGLASYPKHAGSAQEIIQIADEAMYYGKNKSRNIVYKAS